MKKSVLDNNRDIFIKCYKANPKYMIFFIMDCIRNNLVIFLEFTLGLNFVLESAELGRPFRNVLLYLVGLFIFIVLGMVFNSWLNEKYKLKVMPSIKCALKKELFLKAREVDLECYDNPNYYDEFVLVISEADNQIDRMYNLINQIVSSLTTFVLTGVFFLVKDAVSLIFVILMFFSSFFIGKYSSKLNVKMRMLKNKIERKQSYIHRTFYLADYAKEMRLNNKISEVLLEDYDQNNNELYSIEKKYAFKRFGIDFLKEYVFDSFLHNVVYMTYLIYRAAVLKVINYSNVVVLFKAATKIKKSMKTFAGIYPAAVEISMYYEKTLLYLNSENKIISKKNRKLPDAIEKIELRHVYFSYSGDENYVLEDINMVIHKNDNVALVGFNGAGKTTLIKLIMRLYDVTKGEILINDINIKEFEIEEYRRFIGIVFQDFKIYAASLAENIKLDFVHETDVEELISAIKASDFQERYDSLPKGLNTELTTEFETDGVNLSGGESQKVALTRMFYKNSSFLILDEPSSALDPISEYNFNKSILEAGKNKIAIFISHRLSTTRKSDHIFVLQEGKLVEEGSHSELIEKNKVYAKMWQAQAGHYIDS